jgi:carboxylesterase
MTQNELVGLHLPFRKRALSKDELLLTKPLFIRGFDPKSNDGILLVHGFSGTPAIWQSLASKLTKLGFTISCPLLAGHAKKSEDMLSICWQDWYQSAEDALHELTKYSHKITIIGHSLGGALALQLAAKYPLIKKLFLISPAIYPTSSFKFFIKTGLASCLIRLGFKFLPPIGGNIKKPDAWEFAYPNTATHALLELYKCMEVTKKILPQVKVAVTIFQSHHDLLVPPKKTLELIDKLGSAQKELIWLDNSYHVIPIDNDAETLEEFILNKLQ